MFQYDDTNFVVKCVLSLRRVYLSLVHYSTVLATKHTVFTLEYLLCMRTLM